MLLDHLLLAPLRVLFLRLAHLFELVDSSIVLQPFSVPVVLFALIVSLEELERLAVGVTRGYEDLILGNGLVALGVDCLTASRGFLQFVLQVDGLLLNLVLFQ